MRRRRWFGKAYEDGFASGQRRARAGVPLLGGATLKGAALHEHPLGPDPTTAIRVAFGDKPTSQIGEPFPLMTRSYRLSASLWEPIRARASDYCRRPCLDWSHELAIGTSYGKRHGSASEMTRPVQSARSIPLRSDFSACLDG